MTNQTQEKIEIMYDYIPGTWTFPDIVAEGTINLLN